MNYISNTRWLLGGCFACMAFSFQSCGSDSDMVDISGHPLQVNASIGSLDVTPRSLVLGNAFGSGEAIGVTVTDPAGKPYPGNSDSYTNIRYESVGTDGLQTWQGAEMKLKEKGQAIAYYPYDAAHSGTVITVSTKDQLDYMYSGWEGGLSSSDPTVTFKMKHGLAAIRIRMTRGDYSSEKPCAITTVGAYSPAFGTSGKLDIATGKLSDVEGISQMSEYKPTVPVELPEQGNGEKVWETFYITAVPNQGVKSDALVKVVIDNLTFTAPMTMKDLTTQEALGFEQGNLYCIDLVVNNTFLGVSTVYVTPWSTESVNGSVTEQ